MLGHLTEAHTELGDTAVARWYGRATLRANAENQYVLPYLRRLGAESERALSCRAAGDSLPSAGLYALMASDGHLLCLAPTDESDGTLVPCLRIGRVHVGQSRAAVERELGTPWRSVPVESGKGGTAHAYLVFRDSVRQEAAYYVVQYEHAGGLEVVFSLQLTAAPPPIRLSFSCLELGVSPKAVTRQLGPPSSVEPLDVPDLSIHGHVWYWDSAPVSVEIVGGRLYSIRVWRPTEMASRVRTLSGPPGPGR